MHRKSEKNTLEGLKCEEWSCFFYIHFYFVNMGNGEVWY